MKRMYTARNVGIALGVVVFLVVVFSVQIFLSFRQQYGSAVSNEVTERSRAFTEQVKETLQKQQSSTEQP